MKKLIILMLTVAVLLGAGGVALTLRERNEAQRERDDARTAAEEWKEKALKLETGTAQLRKERDTAQTALKQAQEQLVVAAQKAEKVAASGGASKSGIQGAQDKEGLGGPTSAKPMKAFSDMMKNPAMREMMKKQQVAQLDMLYGGLMSRFQLSDEEKTNFKQLLADRMQLDGEVGLQMMDASVTPEQRAALMKQLADSKKSSADRIKTFLNSDEDYKTFQNWEDSMPERTQLSMGQSLFSAAGEPLSPAQEEQLVQSMMAIRRQPGQNLPDLNKTENINPSNLTTAQIDRQLAKVDSDNQNVLQEASRYLSAKQLEALKSMQQQWRAMQEVGLRMSSEMMGGKK